MTKLNFELPTAEELGRMQSARERGLGFVRTELGIDALPPDRSAISMLQVLVDRIGDSEDLLWEPLGILFGDILVHEANFRWMFIDGDQWGRRIALVRQSDNGETQMVNLMLKLFELAQSDTPVNLRQMFDSYTSPRSAE